MCEDGPIAAAQLAAVEAAGALLADRMRRYPASYWRRAAGQQRSVADVTQHLVQRLAEFEHAVEVGSAPAPERWRHPAPPSYPGALPDHLAVVTADFAAAARAAPADWQVWYDGELVALLRVITAAGEEIGRTKQVLSDIR